MSRSVQAAMRCGLMNGWSRSSLNALTGDCPFGTLRLPSWSRPARKRRLFFTFTFPHHSALYPAGGLGHALGFGEAS